MVQRDTVQPNQAAEPEIPANAQPSLPWAFHFRDGWEFCFLPPIIATTTTR